MRQESWKCIRSNYRATASWYVPEDIPELRNCLLSSEKMMRKEVCRTASQSICQGGTLLLTKDLGRSPWFHLVTLVTKTTVCIHVWLNTIGLLACLHYHIRCGQRHVLNVGIMFCNQMSPTRSLPPPCTCQVVIPWNKGRAGKLSQT